MKVKGELVAILSNVKSAFYRDVIGDCVDAVATTKFVCIRILKMNFILKINLYVIL